MVRGREKGLRLLPVANDDTILFETAIVSLLSTSDKMGDYSIIVGYTLDNKKEKSPTEAETNTQV